MIKLIVSFTETLSLYEIEVRVTMPLRDVFIFLSNFSAQKLSSGGLSIVCPRVILWSFGEKSPCPDVSLDSNCQPLD